MHYFTLYIPLFTWTHYFCIMKLINNRNTHFKEIGISLLIFDSWKKSVLRTYSKYNKWTLRTTARIIHSIIWCLLFSSVLVASYYFVFVSELFSTAIKHHEKAPNSRGILEFTLSELIISFSLSFYLKKELKKTVRSIFSVKESTLVYL